MLTSGRFDPLALRLPLEQPSDPDASPAVVLLSGRLDSTALLYFAQGHGLAVRALHVDYGQAAAEAERTAVARVCAAARVDADVVRYAGRTFGPGEIPLADDERVARASTVKMRGIETELLTCKTLLDRAVKTQMWWTEREMLPATAWAAGHDVLIPDARVYKACQLAYVACDAANKRAAAEFAELRIPVTVASGDLPVLC